MKTKRAWFEQLWNTLPATLEAKNALLARLRALCEHKAPSLVYLSVLFAAANYPEPVDHCDVCPWSRVVVP